MSSFFYLNYEDILQIHQDVIDDSGGGKGIRDRTGIDIAVDTPQTSYFGEDQYPTLVEKAAILCFILIIRHPFIDGNKRVGHSAMAHFLYMNGFIIDSDDSEQEAIILKVAAGEMDKETFTEWLKSKTIPFKP